ncbi:phosphotransferase [Streptomyces sp. CB01881]|uniref:phosphotransferase n=1 Tax=Streptomyces sp. CB01881 TaxID=2078691 RepID=UPI000CDC0DB1|nr:phosphotransferase [Streptomyces sp. CB01881]AUY50417.1 hypothetical protein C2142_17435 [Streptomyces sp. CB01881]TYC73804.1 hypothetical protein EH183_17415 [Streptomyces sp. CB01881]
MDIDLRSALRLGRDAFGIAAEYGEKLAGGASANWSAAVHEKQAGEPRWVLRCCLRDPRPERIAFLQEFASAARRSGLPAPVPHRTVDGRWWTADDDGRPWVLLSHLPGVPLAGSAITEAGAASAGALLSSLHALDTGPAAGAPGPDSPWDAWLTSPEAAWQATEHACGQDAGLLQAYEPFVEALRRAGAPLVELTDRSVTHGDFHGHNLLTCSGPAGPVSAVIDLDAVALRPRAFDLATAILMLARTGSGDYRLQPHLARALLSGYQRGATRPITHAEHAALWPAMVLSQLPDPGHLAALRRRGLPLRQALVRPLAALQALGAQRPLAAVPRPRRPQPGRLVLGCDGAQAAVTGPGAFLDALAEACRPWLRAAAPETAPDGMWTLHAEASVGRSGAVVASRSGAEVRRAGRAREVRVAPPTGTGDVLVPAVRLLRALMRRQLAASGELFLDAAVLDLRGRGVALVGGSCSGKTSTLISALHRHPSRLVANDDASVRLVGPDVQARGYPRAVEVRRESLVHLGSAAGLLEHAAAGSAPAGPLYLTAPAFAAALGVPTAAAVRLDALVLLTAWPYPPALRRLGPGEAAARISAHLAPADPYEGWLDLDLPVPAPLPHAAARLTATLPVWELAQPITALAESADLLATHDLGGHR